MLFDMELAVFVGSSVIGFALMMLIVYFIFGRGVALKLTFLVSGFSVTLAATTFFLLKSGYTVLNTALAMVVVFPIVTGLFIMMIRQIIIPIRRMAEAADGIAKGDLDQSLTIKNNDELGDMAASFQEMITYLQTMARSADSLAQGVLTVRVTPQSEQDVLGISFSQMTVNLNTLIKQVQESADQVASASVQLNASADQAGQASQQVAATSQQVAQGTSRQTQSLAEATGSVEQMARAADGIARGAQEQAQSIQKMSDLIGEMANVVDRVGNITGSTTDATQVAGTIRTQTAIAVEKVKEMGVRSKEIGRIVETIDEIADKTDMLALNAAVEAARAGEHGRGFAVVADQVRKLSEDSKGATRDINTLIERVQEAINEAVTSVEGTAALAGQISEAVAQLKQKSEGVVTTVEMVSAVVGENTATAEEMAANTQEVSDAMESVAGIAEENSAATEEVSASAEEMSAQVEEVVASAEELSSLAEELRLAAARFRLNGGYTDRTQVNDEFEPNVEADRVSVGKDRGGNGVVELEKNNLRG